MIKWIFIILCLGLLAYEGYTLANRSAGDTISEIIWALAVRYPLVPFLFGLLMGHFFWQRNG